MPVDSGRFEAMNFLKLAVLVGSLAALALGQLGLWALGIVAFGALAFWSDLIKPAEKTASPPRQSKVPYISTLSEHEVTYT